VVLGALGESFWELSKHSTSWRDERELYVSTVNHNQLKEVKGLEGFQINTFKHLLFNNYFGFLNKTNFLLSTFAEKPSVFISVGSELI
jgi:hypothetical protein